jgi:hypothetical protein
MTLDYTTVVTQKIAKESERNYPQGMTPDDFRKEKQKTMQFPRGSRTHPAIKCRDADAGGEPEEAPDKQQRPLGRRPVPELVAVLPAPPRRNAWFPAAAAPRSRGSLAASAPVREPAVQVPQ